MDFNLVIASRFYHQPWWWSCWNLMETWGPWNGIPSGRWLGYLVGVPWLSCFAVKDCRALIRGHGHDAMATAIAGAWMFRSWDHIFHDQNLPSGYDIASSPWNITMLLIGKPSISMGHGFHSYVSLPEGNRDIVKNSYWLSHIITIMGLYGIMIMVILQYLWNMEYLWNIYGMMIDVAKTMP